jgi:structural maintenance of chromosome 4
MDNISGSIEMKTATIAKLQSNIEKHKLEASEACKVEQVFALQIIL